MNEDINDLDDPTGELKAEANRQLLDLLARDPEAFMLWAQNLPGNLRLWLQDTPLTKNQADDLRGFILSLEPRACLVQPDTVDVFGIDSETAEKIIAKLREFGVEPMPIAPAPLPRCE
jgi:hypothetical protein